MKSIIVLFTFIYLFCSCSSNKESRLKYWKISINRLHAKDSSDAIFEMKFTNTLDTNYFIIYHVYNKVYSEAVRNQWNAQKILAAESSEGHEFVTGKYYIINWHVTSQRHCTQVLNNSRFDVCNEVINELELVLNKNHDADIYQIVTEMSADSH